ncbi:LysR family transcriptional regulator [Nocardia arthritidis]|uniref:LysR family transcriptional regulator n=1 Tax=Nocardia arthritidis TaxID=228602 RepID=A0A6G9YDY3_9NOCA|nr:LysR family transcriptional regulator [Nocardia arthritidis]QIS11439.1 LysR family transcriptional regulator [Nocardia arthritidis]
MTHLGGGMGKMVSSGSRIEVRHLRALVTLVEQGSFTRASNALFVSQPALSRTVAQLERLIDARLVDRSGQQVTVTEAGARLLPYAHRVLTTIREAEHAVRGQRIVLRVGFTWTAAGVYTAEIVREFEETCPGAQVELVRTMTPLAGLDEGDTHVAFLRSEPPDDRVASAFLLSEPRVAALPADHPLSNRRTVSLRDLAAEPLVIGIVGTTEVDLWGHATDGRMITTARNIDEWLEAIAAKRGVGVTPLSTTTFHGHPHVRFRELTDAPPVFLKIVWLNTTHHPLRDAFVKIAIAVTQRARTLPAADE